MRWKRSGYTLIELMMVALILIITSATVGTGFVKLCSIELVNREKARTLEALCRHYAKTQPFVSAGSSVQSYSNSVSSGVRITYPHIIFGIACETNNFTQVTNTLIYVKDDGVLRTSILAGRTTGNRSSESSYFWLDPIFAPDAQPVFADCSVRGAGGTVVMSYKYNISIDDADQSVMLTVPICLKNAEYQ